MRALNHSPAMSKENLPATISETNLSLPPIIWWVLWAALQTTIFVYYLVFSSVFASAKPLLDQDNSLWLLALAPLAVSAGLRWLVIPGIQKLRLVFALFIAGMGLAEVACLIGLVLFPAHRLDIFLWSALGVLQFIPFFVQPLSKTGSGDVRG